MEVSSLALEGSLFVETPHLRVHYLRGGQGQEKLVFVHGNYASSRWWNPQLERLPPGFQGFAPDLRGCGGSDGKTQKLQSQRDGRLSIRDLADDLAEFIGALKISAPILVGHSFGGLVVIDYALRNQESVRGIVLEDTGPPDGLPLTDLTQPLFIPLELGSRELMKNALRLVGLPPRGELSDALVDDAMTSSRQYRAFTRAAGKWSVESLLPDLQVPTLLVWGSKDRVMPARIGRRYLSLLPNAKMVTIPGAGHSPHLECPDEFAAVLKDFVEKHASGTKGTSPKEVTPRRMQLKDTLARLLRF
jgi:branched-chain amino acid transport system permease protein